VESERNLWGINCSLLEGTDSLKYRVRMWAG